jgi:hypothetical protein
VIFNLIYKGFQENIEIWDSHSRVPEDSGLLICDVFIDVSKESDAFIFWALDVLVRKINPPRSFGLSETTRPKTQRHIPEELKM